MKLLTGAAVVLVIVAGAAYGGWVAHRDAWFGTTAKDAARHVARIESWRDVTCRRDDSTGNWDCAGVDVHGCQLRTVYDGHETHRIRDDGGAAVSLPAVGSTC